MIPKRTSENPLSQVADTILLELKGRGSEERPNEGTLYYIISAYHTQLSREELREGLTQLLGRTPEHRTTLICRDEKGGYYIPEDPSPELMGSIIRVVHDNQHHEGANYFHIMRELQRLGLDQGIVMKALRRMTEQRLLCDSVGRYTLSPDIPKERFEALITHAVNPTQGAR